MKRPLIADLYCKAGGAAMGLHRAGFQVVGFDIEPQPRYPFPFVLQDALTVDLSKFDAVWASPPCQHASALNKGTNRNHEDHPDLIQATRDIIPIGMPRIIENVPGAKALSWRVMLCGSLFDPPLGVRRHRLFESSVLLLPPYGACRHTAFTGSYRFYEHGAWRVRTTAPVYGHGGGKAREQWAEAMGIDWMTRAELSQAIPPVYSEHLGKQLIKHV
jgi:DNA (cytosine-5)-methyltransferase 1